MKTQTIPATILKFLGAEELGPDEFEADLITGNLDLAGDIVPASGADKSKGSVPLLWNHDPSDVIGVAHYKRVGGKIVIKCRLTPLGTSKSGNLAREVTKRDYGMGVSVGMQPTAPPTPIKGTRGVTFNAYHICEASVVSVPADQSARITARNFDADRAARIARAREVDETTRRQEQQLGAIDSPHAPCAPLTKAQRLAMVEAVVRRGQSAAPPAELTGAAAYAAERGRHAFAVGSLQRQAHPTREDRLVMAQRHADRERVNNPKFGG